MKCLSVYRIEIQTLHKNQKVFLNFIFSVYNTYSNMVLQQINIDNFATFIQRTKSRQTSSYFLNYSIRSTYYLSLHLFSTYTKVKKIRYRYELLFPRQRLALCFLFFFVCTILYVYNVFLI